MAPNKRVEVVEYTDVMCSWAWGSEPKLRLLRWGYEDRCDWRLAMGGLVGDRTQEPGWDPVEQGRDKSALWASVSAHTGGPYPRQVSWAAASSEASGIALCAARLQGDAVSQAVLRRMREAIFIFGRPPDTAARVIDAVRDTPGMDLPQFERDLVGDEARDAYQKDWEETRKPNDFVRQLEGNWSGIGNLKQTEGHDRYAFPTLLFRGPGGEHTVPGWCPFDAYIEAMEKAAPGSTADPRPNPTPQEAFERWPMLTSVELKLLCSDEAEPPSGAKTYDWGHGELYLRPDLYPSL